MAKFFAFSMTFSCPFTMLDSSILFRVIGHNLHFALVRSHHEGTIPCRPPSLTTGHQSKLKPSYYSFLETQKVV